MDLEHIAREARKLTVRAIKNCGSGHPGGSLSCIDILVYLHTQVLRPQPYHPNRANDIFLLSGGHKVPALYSLWSVLGWWPESEALALRKLGAVAQGHPSRLHTPWCWTSTGSLGQGTATSVGFALAYKRQGLDKKVYVLLGEGDLNEGVTLEAMRLAVHYELNNLIWILDHNHKMSDRHSCIMVSPGREAHALGWLVVDGIDGHSFPALRDALDLAEVSAGRPVFIVARTVKAKGVPGWEADLDGMHGSVRLSDEDLVIALEAING